MLLYISLFVCARARAKEEAEQRKLSIAPRCLNASGAEEIDASGRASAREKTKRGISRLPHNARERERESRSCAIYTAARTTTSLCEREAWDDGGLAGRERAHTPTERACECLAWVVSWDDDDGLSKLMGIHTEALLALGEWIGDMCGVIIFVDLSRRRLGVLVFCFGAGYASFSSSKGERFSSGEGILFGCG